MTERIPTESDEQKALMRWAAYNRGRYPELALLYHIPNEGQRDPRVGARMMAEGLRKGVPDLCLPVARGGSHGLYIELKRTKGGRVSPEQAAWIDSLLRQGYAACVCRGWEAASREIERYLQGGTDHGRTVHQATEAD